MIECPYCGQSNPAANAACQFCGGRLPLHDPRPILLTPIPQAGAALTYRPDAASQTIVYEYSDGAGHQQQCVIDLQEFLVISDPQAMTAHIEHKLARTFHLSLEQLAVLERIPDESS